MELIIDVDLKRYAIDLEDGSYDVCTHEFDFNLDPAIQSKLIDKEKFEPQLWYTNTYKDVPKVVVKNSEIDEASFRFAVNDLLDQCGWFQMYSVAVVSDINYVDGYISVFISEGGRMWS